MVNDAVVSGPIAPVYNAGLGHPDDVGHIGVALLLEVLCARARVCVCCVLLLLLSLTMMVIAHACDVIGTLVLLAMLNAGRKRCDRVALSAL